MARPKPAVEYVAPPKRCSLPVSTMLPPSARTLLAQAANTDPDAAPGESLVRSRALDRAIQQVRFTNSKLFKE
jgi:hypothetical protein